MKRSILLSALVLIAAFAKAQTGDKIALGVSGDVVLPTSNSVGGPGFTVRLELPVASQLNFTFSAGYFANFFGRRLYAAANPPEGVSEPMGPANDGPYQFVPVKLGLRYYYFNHFYFEGNTGVAFKANVTKTSFVYGGSIGDLIPFNKHNFLDLGFGIENGYKLADYNEAIAEIAFRIGYRYQF